MCDRFIFQRGRPLSDSDDLYSEGLSAVRSASAEHSIDERLKVSSAPDTVNSQKSKENEEKSR